ncbi:COG4315 family predicted lipoprotein [Catellatospora methionotrophica]|uniref:COG4315 family predicted lipoprotein n=1 Tax=Catellatospora methionotrophica TaxID=121620 RepID=UPI0033C9DCC7
MFVRRFALLAAVTTAGALGACAESTTPPAGAVAAGVSAVAVAASPSAARAAVHIANVGGRKALVDQQGRTLYVFLRDAKGKSACLDKCAVTWPPMVGDAINGEGVDGFLLSTYTRPDGTVQTTYRNLPLYRFGTDRPGDAHGQGMDGAWFMLDENGEMYQW